jgi:hypothetical protein
MGGVLLALLRFFAATESINRHRPSQDHPGTSVVALLSVGVGALLGGVVRAIVDRYAIFVESRGMAVALGAEIAAILQIVQARQYRSLVAAVIDRLQSPTSTPTLDDALNIRVAQDYFAVFHALRPKIGLFGTLSEGVTLLYTVGKSLLEDLLTLRDIHERARSEPSVLDRGELLVRSQSAAFLFQVLLERGQQTVDALPVYAERRWWGLS